MLCNSVYMIYKEKLQGRTQMCDVKGGAGWKCWLQTSIRKIFLGHGTICCHNYVGDCMTVKVDGQNLTLKRVTFTAYKLCLNR